MCKLCNIRVLCATLETAWRRGELHELTHTGEQEVRVKGNAYVLFGGNTMTAHRNKHLWHGNDLNMALCVSTLLCDQKETPGKQTKKPKMLRQWQR